MSRFERQHILPGFGMEGQKKLTESKVLVIGAGGLGCPALIYLAAAGVGNIGIADGDNISESNLNRQILFGENDICKLKAPTAAGYLEQKYSDINFYVIPEYLTPKNALQIIRDYDVVLDGSDNFGTRYMVNDACVLLKKPLVMGAIYQFEGQVAVFNYGEQPVNYRDMYPVVPDTHEIPNCSETGVLGVLPGIIGTLQAAEVIKLISGMGQVLTNKVLFYNLKSCSFYEVEVKPRSGMGDSIPQTEEAFTQTDYNLTCGLVEKITWENALHWTREIENSIIIDIREPKEEPEFDYPDIIKIPMDKLLDDTGVVEGVEEILLFCKSGNRSMKLARQLRKKFPEKKIFSIEGGILDSSSPLKKEFNGT